LTKYPKHFILHDIKMCMSRFRCPNCGLLNSIQMDKIFDGRFLLRCSKCNICSILPLNNNLEETYLDFLDLYDRRCITTTENLRSLMEQEKIIRSELEVRSFITKNSANNNDLIKQILYSDKDYVVDFKILEESDIELGSKVSELPIDESLIAALSESNIKRVYKFQEEAMRKILLGKDIIIIAPTASGKTEAFSIPVLQKISEDISHFGSLRPSSKKNKISAIFVYPTKSLSRDQLPKIKGLAESVGLHVDLLDGDTSRNERESILSSPPDAIITNFDVIHYHLMHRTRFSRLIRNAKYLIVDEAHVYTGVFGANVHFIIKRLERLSPNKKIQLIASSATLPNADNFCQVLFDRKMEIVQGKGRKGRINFIILFPSLRSHRSLTIDLLKYTTRLNHKTIAFNNSHLGSELLAFYASKQGVKIMVHRAGILPAIRKFVENSFRRGELHAISATPTLELGIDIGDVDAIISNIVPINRLIQRLGRAARRGQLGYAFLALGNDPISQYYKFHPDDYLADEEHAYTDPSNPIVEEYQVLAMTCDRPISMFESYGAWNTIQKLISKNLVKVINEKFMPDYKKAIEVLHNYNIRGIGSNVDIIFNKKIVGERSLPQALEELHVNAIYFLSGRRYQVKKLHWKKESRQQHYAELIQIPNDYPYYTKAIVDEWPSVRQIYDKKKVFGIEVKYCSLKILKRILGYSNIEIGQEATQGKKVMLENPLEFEFLTKGFLFRAPRPLNNIIKATDEQYIEMSSYHASEHVIIEGSGMITGGAPQDLAGISLGSSGYIYVYDGSIGGNGASKVIYDRLDSVLSRALRILSECPCKSESGCPRCTYSYRCGNNNEYLHKDAAIEILNRVVEGERTEIDDKDAHLDRALV
jgi:DEAD/DEAH box helicase domain-containing protein